MVARPRYQLEIIIGPRIRRRPHNQGVGIRMSIPSPHCSLDSRIVITRSISAIAPIRGASLSRRWPVPMHIPRISQKKAQSIFSIIVPCLRVV